MSSAYTVDRKRWADMSIFEQMGNTYAEVGRTIQAKNTGDEARFKAALTRAIDLFDATVEAQLAKSPHRIKEVLRAEDQFLSLFYGEQSSPTEQHKLENYFMQFAIAARLRR